MSRAIREHNAEHPSLPVEELMLHTGQHYDTGMSQVFFEEMDIPRPHRNLNVSSPRHGEMTGRMLAGIEDVLLAQRPDLVLTYGDTNSTLAGALAAVKLHIPVAHVEAGLRSHKMRMPEEVNRVLTDRVSSLLFCPTDCAVANLAAEGIHEGVHLVGDVMYDACLFYRDRARQKSKIIEQLGLENNAYALATCHRAENTRDPHRLREILKGLAEIARALPVVWPLHPRTQKLIDYHGLGRSAGAIRLIDPISYLDMMRLEQSARAIITDSGGVQKEAYFYRIPCITLRDETEWIESVESGWNRLAGADSERIVAAFVQSAEARCLPTPAYYGDGQTVRRILAIMLHRPPADECS